MRNAVSIRLHWAVGGPYVSFPSLGVRRPVWKHALRHVLHRCSLVELSELSSVTLVDKGSLIGICFRRVFGTLGSMENSAEFWYKCIPVLKLARFLSPCEIYYMPLDIVQVVRRTSIR